MMPENYIPMLEIFMGILGFGLSILFCTTFCRACSRLREEQIEREAWRRSEHDERPPSIYFIPLAGNISQQDGEDHFRIPRYSEEIQAPPRYSTAACGPPPSYNELGIKPDDLPPPYTQYNLPVYPGAHTTTPSDPVQPQTQSQP